MIAPGATVFVDGRAACVLAVEPLEEWDPATGEQVERATVLQFAAPDGRDHLREPAIRTVTIDGGVQANPPRSRHGDVRELCRYLGAQKRALDSRQRDLLRVLVDLERLAS